MRLAFISAYHPRSYFPSGRAKSPIGRHPKARRSFREHRASRHSAWVRPGSDPAALAPSLLDLARCVQHRGWHLRLDLSPPSPGWEAVLRATVNCSPQLPGVRAVGCWSAGQTVCPRFYCFPVKSLGAELRTTITGV